MATAHRPSEYACYHARATVWQRPAGETGGSCVPVHCTGGRYVPRVRSIGNFTVLPPIPYPTLYVQR